jgi:hypothetical protein
VSATVIVTVTQHSNKLSARTESRIRLPKKGHGFFLMVDGNVCSERQTLADLTVDVVLPT